MYILSTGCQWQSLPNDLPPKSTGHDYFSRWDYDGTLKQIHDTLYLKCREQVGREPSPTVGAIDSQSVKSAEKGGARIDPNGYDAGKKIKGKMRHILVDMLGLLLHAVVHPANIQDRVVAYWCLPRRSRGIRIYANCLPTPATRGRSSAKR